jgi:nicotinamide-nucleotide adenylyltransferase
LLIEAGYPVKRLDLYQRYKFEATEIRRRILAGEEWDELVPIEVHKIVMDIDGDNRIRDLARSDSVNNNEARK